MELVGDYVMTFIEKGGLFAPLLFISFHLLRPFLFLPVIFICISGGMLFGAVAGTLYSLIGVTLSSVTFYGMIRWMPNTFKKLVRLKNKVVGKQPQMTTPQITLLRLVPFIHFHLLSLCLIEVSTGFRDYTKSSLLSSIPFALIYTSIGQSLADLSLVVVLTLFFFLLVIIYLIRKKEMYIKWQDFFKSSGTHAKTENESI